MKKISILGSTGSIGTQSLDVVRNMDGFEVVGLSAHSNVELLFKQIMEFKPRHVSVGDESKRRELISLLKENGMDTDVMVGMEGLIEIAGDESELLITSVVGMIGLVPTLEAIKCNKTIALANKETLVTAGHIVMDEIKRRGVKIIPVDSEHSAIYQCLNGERRQDLDKILLTASGGPFRGKNREFLKNVTVKDALRHPNWSMGRKITVDSATLMNKGLEIIEAKWLFDVEVEKIEPIVHPQSIIHSMVQFNDGSILAHLGAPDMRIPIQYALTEPERAVNGIEKIDLKKIATLTFEEPDTETFKALRLAIDAIKAGGTMPTVLNAANEVLVDLFLKEKISFLDIADIVERSMDDHKLVSNPSLDQILDADRNVRKQILTKYN